MRSLPSAARRSAARVASSRSGTMPRSSQAQPSDSDQAAQRVAIRVVDRTRLERLARHGELVAGGKQRHPRSRRDLQRRRADRRGEPERLRRQASPAGEHHRAGAHILAAPADPLARRRPDVDAHAARLDRLAVLLHDDRIRAGGNLRTGEDARRRARPQRGADHARGNALAHRQRRRLVRARRRRAARSRPSRCCRPAARRAPETTSLASTRPSASKVDSVCAAATGPTALEQPRQRLIERQQRGRGWRRGRGTHSDRDCPAGSRRWHRPS